MIDFNGSIKPVLISGIMLKQDIEKGLLKTDQ